MAITILMALCVVVLPARADSSVGRIGVGTAFAMPELGVSLFGRINDEWSGTLALGFGLGIGGTEARLNYAIGESRDRYLTFGGGYFADIGVVRAGYGRVWQRGPWRWHLEATLNLPVYLDVEEGLDGFASLNFAAFTLIVPVGFGVHYTFD